MYICIFYSIYKCFSLSVYRLFQENAHLTKLFRGFKELDNADDMRENEMFEHHATLVMSTLDEAFSHLDNLDFVVDLLHKTGSTHRKFAGFLPNLFWVSFFSG